MLNKLKNIISDVFRVNTSDIEINVENKDIYINLDYCKIYGSLNDRLSLSFIEVDCSIYYTADDFRSLANMLDEVEEEYNN